MGTTSQLSQINNVVNNDIRDGWDNDGDGWGSLEEEPVRESQIV